MGANDMPDSNTAALSKYMRLPVQTFSAKELEEARDELLDHRMTGPKLWESLQEWLNVDSREYDQRLQQIGQHLHDLLTGADVDRAKGETWAEYQQAKYVAARCNAREWLAPIVNATISEDEVLERAEHIAADREEG
jgi:hypothetical protein